MDSVDSSLQNHPGDVEFPVRPRRRYAAMADARRRADRRGNGRRALALVAIAAPVGVAGMAVATIANPSGRGIVNPVFFFVIAMCLGIVLATLFFTARDSAAPVQAQKEYLARSGRTPLTLRQQQMLALDSVSDFSIRGWNSSLAFGPTFAELPDDLRQRHRDGQEGSPWAALPIPPLQQYRASLDEQFKIASRTDVEVFAADALAVAPISARFAEVSASEHGDVMRSRVAALSDCTVFDLLDLVAGDGSAPPRLLLAGDIERTIGGIRYAYCAGYIDAETAWRLIEPVAERAFRTYPDADAYWREVMISLAFRSDSLEAVQRHRENLRALRASPWPAARVPWPEVARSVS